MLKKVLYVLAVILMMFISAAPVYAGDQTVFGPEVFQIDRWHIHLSLHRFNVDDPGEGIIIVTKNTPNMKIRRGFILFNRRFIPLRSFLRGDDLVFEKKIKLRSRNYLAVFLLGTPGASITIEVRRKAHVPPPEVTFSADPSTITPGESSTLSWSTTNADSVSIEPGIGDVEPSGSLSVSPEETTTYTLTATGPGGRTTESVTVTVIIPPPNVTISADPETIQQGRSSTLTWSSTYADSCEIDQGIGAVDTSGSTTVSPAETTTYTITATGPGGTAQDSATVTVTYPSPTVSISATPGIIAPGELSTLSWTSTHASTCFIEPDIGPVDPSGSITVAPIHTTTYTITAMGLGGTAGAQTVVMVTAEVEPQPEGSFGRQYEDLIPPDATVGSYDPKRFSVITGQIQDLEGSPIADVAITIHDHPEYGTAISDAGGRFSIPVEGGSTLTVVCQKEGLLTAQRKVYVPWNDIAIAETIVMITEDPASTTLTFNGDPNTVVVHQSTEVTDEFGTRACTMVFAGNNRAYAVDAEGEVIQELITITTRATEFTTPESMPAKLPPTSLYTYCAELSVVGAKRVKFEEPVISWVDNFLGFDVGEVVPVGYYDRDRGVWVPCDNGVVVRLLDTDTDGVVDALDADGDDEADDLDEDGSLSDEVIGLSDPGRYPSGSTFWRVAVSHFSPCDYNWPYGPPADAIPPNPEGEPSHDGEKPEEDDCMNTVSSYATHRNRTFHEDISIPGTDIALHYASSRVEGFLYKITVPASGETVPASLKRIIVKVDVAGRVFEENLDPLPNQKAEFIWDGLDHLGWPVIGPVTARVSVGFVYDAVYYGSRRDLERSFAQAGIAPTAILARQEITIRKGKDLVIHRMSARVGTIAEGWTLSVHHSLSPQDLSVLFKGDGTTTRNNVNIIDTVAGNGERGYGGDGGPATEAQFNRPRGMAFDAAGNLYIADWSNNRIRKVDVSGIITTVAGNGTEGYSGDGGPATEAQLYLPFDVAMDGSGNLYIADWQNHRIRKVDLSGIITTVAGNSPRGGHMQGGYGGDGGPATEALLNEPCGVAVDAMGNIYIADSWNYRIRKVDPSGFINTVAGNGLYGYSGDGGPAIEARIAYPYDVTVDGAGNFYIADESNYRIRKVDTSGIITTVAGNGAEGYGGDGGPATEAELKYPIGVAMDAMGSFYIADHNRIRKVDVSGIITTVAGNGTWGYGGDGGPATEAQLYGPSGLAFDVLGHLYIADTYNYRIRKVALPSIFAAAMPGGDIVFAEQEGLGYILSTAGHHKWTIDLDTGNVVYEFGYNENNQLVSITDRFGTQLTIERDESGVPASITSPDGITTRLTVDANNHLTRITYPDGSYYGFEYPPNGLMTAETEPEGNRFENSYGSTGRLTDATDQEGGHWQYSGYVYENGDILTEVLTAEGSLTSYLDQYASTGAYTSTITDPTGAQTVFSRSDDGLSVTKSLPCGMELAYQYGIDPEYKFKYVREMRESTPSGLESITSREITYQDRDSDDIPDLITDSVTVNGKVRTLETDTLQSKKILTSPEGRAVTTFCDPDTLLTTNLLIPGLYETNFGYDPRGRLTSISTDTRQVTINYDGQGNLATINYPEGNSTSYTYDAVGRMAGIHRPDGSSVGFVYDKNGNMTVLTNPSTIDHGFGYSGVNLNTSYQTPLSGTYSYVYDRDRRLIRIHYPSGKQISIIYDKGRPVQIQTPEGNIDITYHCGTMVESITNGMEAITYGYDGSLVTSETLSGTLNQSLLNTYDNDFHLDFHLTDFTYAGGSVDFTYDEDAFLTGAGDFAITRNAENGLPEEVFGGSLDLTRIFNDFGEVEGQDFTVSGRDVTSWVLTRDNAGRITAKTETVEGATSNYEYTYDPMGRLMTVTKDWTPVEEYQYGPNGTRIYEMNSLKGISGRTMTYSDEDHLLTAGDTSYQYDLDGFLTIKTQGADVTTYEYSSRGELLKVTLPDWKVIEYIYDPLGRRIVKKVDGAIIEKYLWECLTRLLAVYDESNNLVMRFEYADGRMPLAMTRGGSTYYLTYDQVGSLRMVADTSGNVVKRIDYDSFGSIINDTNPSFTIPFGFAGGLHDRDIGLVTFGFRDYDPDIGRWTAKDPIGFLGGGLSRYGYVINNSIYKMDPKDPIFFDGVDVDLYGYCLNNPVNFIDPFGLLTYKQLWAAIKAGTTAGLPPVAKEITKIALEGPCPGIALLKARAAFLARDAYFRQQMDEYRQWREVYRGLDKAYIDAECNGL